MRNLIKNKKKKGFTLIEMVAVVAIIGILAAILVPKITGYINEAKKTAVIDQARKVAQAYETAKMKNTLELKNGTTNEISQSTSLYDALKKGDANGNTTMKSLIADDALTNLGGITNKKVTIGHCVAIVSGSDFEIDKDQVLKPNSVSNVATGK
ncbi:type II secretion system protein [Clostridium thermobutyricum]|uniref:type II secretion system protein n=1 Tax=Clostridium thermobutyricum TaxID=29372 RepID=UPI003F51D867